MDWKVCLATFGTIILAELGDKTQLAAIMMTCKTARPLSVFVGAVAALTIVTLLGVVFGEGLMRIVPEHLLKNVAAGVFIVIGVLMLIGRM
ncbi:MAG: hypothetical protein B1H02_06465 [Candidatus Latescibacteria bacterium 4484_107]|nr:MAG: hypothetical protein B1H02_06465 [Candidatus Latescibacteria bacterium 4484_107]